MRKFILELFGEKGDISMMRLLSFICIMTASGIAMRAVIMDRDLSQAAVLCGVFLGAGISGKVIQRGIEAKEGPSDGKQV